MKEAGGAKGGVRQGDGADGESEDVERVLYSRSDKAVGCQDENASVSWSAW